MPVLSNLIVRIGASTDDFDKKVNASLNKIKRFGADVAQAGQALSIGITAPLAGVAAGALAAAAKMESLGNGLAATMKSTKAAAEEMERLKEVAKLPGLNLEDAVKGSIRLQVLGNSADESRRIMMELGNALAVVGGGKEDFSEVIKQLSQLGAAGKVTKENLDPIIERIPQIAAIIKEKFGPAAIGDPAKVFEKMGISSQQFIRIITSELGKSERATAGAKTAFENLQEATAQTAAELGKALLPMGKMVLNEFMNPAIERAKDLIIAFNGLSDSTKATSIELAAFAAAIPVAIVVLGTLTEKFIIISQAVIKFGALIGSLAGVIGPLGAALGAQILALTGFAAGTVQATIAMAAFSAGAALLVVGLANLAYAHYELSAAQDNLNNSNRLFSNATENLLKQLRGKSPLVAELEKKYRSGAISLDEFNKQLILLSRELNKNAKPIANVKTEAEKLVEQYMAAAAAAAALAEKKSKLKPVVDQLANSFERLGVVNTTDVIGSFVLARTAVERIQVAYEQGKVSSVDLQRATEALGQEYLKLIDGLGAIRPKTLEVADSFDFARERAMIAIGDIQMAASSARGLELGQLIMTGEPRRNDDALRAAEQARSAKRGAEMIKILSRDVASDWKKTQQAISRQVSTIVTDLSRGLADIIVSGGKVGQKFEELGKQIAKSLIRTVIENGINQVIKALGGLLSNLGGVAGAIGGLFGGTAKAATSAIPGVVGGAASAAGAAVPAVAGGASTAVGGAAAAASGGATAIVGAVAGVASAISGIIGNFQFAAMNKTLDLIEKEVRYSQIHLLHLLEKNNEYLPKLKDIWDSLIRMETRQMGLAGGGGAVTINISTTGDTRQLLDALTRELKLLGVIPQ
jgi:tape measure domain-containing protein